MADYLKNGVHVVWSAIDTLPDGHQIWRLGKKWTIYCPEDESRTHDCERVIQEHYRLIKKDHGLKGLCEDCTP